jgi:hypothetical protein
MRFVGSGYCAAELLQIEIYFVSMKRTTNIGTYKVHSLQELMLNTISTDKIPFNVVTKTLNLNKSNPK